MHRGDTRRHRGVHRVGRGQVEVERRTGRLARGDDQRVGRVEVDGERLHQQGGAGGADRIAQLGVTRLVEVDRRGRVVDGQGGRCVGARGHGRGAHQLAEIGELGQVDQLRGEPHRRLRAVGLREHDGVERHLVAGEVAASVAEGQHHGAGRRDVTAVARDQRRRRQGHGARAQGPGKAVPTRTSNCHQDIPFDPRRALWGAVPRLEAATGETFPARKAA